MKSIKKTSYEVWEDLTIVARHHVDIEDDAGKITHVGAAQSDSFRPGQVIRKGLALADIDPMVTQLAHALWPAWEGWVFADDVAPKEVSNVWVIIDEARNIFVVTRKDIVDGAGDVTHAGQAHRASLQQGASLPPGMKIAAVPGLVTTMARLFWLDFKGWKETPLAKVKA